MPPIHTTGALPAYLRIAEALTREIGSGRHLPGDKLPPERKLAVAHGVAVATLRKALGVLAERGLIERRHGSGNYVLRSERNVGVYALFRLEHAGRGGGLPTAELLAMELVPKPKALPQIGRATGPAMRIRRLRSLDGIPVAVEEIWLDARWGDPSLLTPERVSESLYRSYDERLGLKISRAEDVIRAGSLPDWTPDTFGRTPGQCVALVERRAFDQHLAPCEASWTWYDPDRAQYFARVP